MESVASCPIVNNKTDLDDVREYDDERLDRKFVGRVVEFLLVGDDVTVREWKLSRCIEPMSK